MGIKHIAEERDMRRRSGGLVCVLLAAVAVVTAFTGCGKAEVVDKDFKDEITGKIGDHIYYSDNVFSSKWYSDSQKEAMMDYLEDVDRNLDVDIFVRGSHYASVTGQYRFYARQYIDGVVVPDVVYSTDLDRPEPNIVPDRKNPPVKEVDTSGLLPASDAIAIVKEAAGKHTDDLCYYSDRGIFGTYLLCYDIRNDILVYEFTVNEFSEVKVDAKTGNIVGEYYWDGTIID